MTLDKIMISRQNSKIQLMKARNLLPYL